jgi:hypothetical protein
MRRSRQHEIFTEEGPAASCALGLFVRPHPACVPFKTLEVRLWHKPPHKNRIDLERRGLRRGSNWSLTWTTLNFTLAVPFSGMRLMQS